MPYSPRVLIQSLRGEMSDHLVEGYGNENSSNLDETLGEEMTWHCTTCGACIDACPVFINPVAEVIDIRRNQRIPPRLGNDR